MKRKNFAGWNVSSIDDDFSSFALTRRADARLLSLLKELPSLKAEGGKGCKTAQKTR